MVCKFVILTNNSKKGAISMSVQVLKDYVEFSREIGEKPTWEGLKEHKKMFWRD